MIRAHAAAVKSIRIAAELHKVINNKGRAELPALIFLI